MVEVQRSTPMLRRSPLVIGHWLLVIAVVTVAPGLAAFDGSAEASRWARRALLDDDVRKHLQLDVGEVEPLDTVLFTPCDIDSEPAHAVVLRHGEATVVTLQRNLECLGRCTFRTTGELSLSTSVMLARTWIIVDEATTAPVRTLTARRLLHLRQGELAVRQSWTQDSTRSIGKRFQRTVKSSLRAEADSLLLTTTTTDLLDNEPMQDAKAEQVRRLTPQPDGSLRTEVQRDQPVTAAVKLRHARTLEREHLEEPALMLAREAREQTERLPADDARRLDASALVARLEARKPIQITEGR